MARALVYTTSRFDGGMTSSPRDVTQRDRFAYLSHFDIYRDTGKMYVMPGYVSDNAFSGSPTGLKQFRIRAFRFVTPNILFALGTKSDGTGTKLMQRNLTDSEWIVPTLSADFATEGTATLPKRPFLVYDNQSDLYYPAVVSGTTRLVRQGAGASGINDTFGTLHAGSIGTSPEAYTAERGFDGVIYMSKAGNSGIAGLNGTVFAQNAKSTAFGTYDVQTGNYQIGITGSLLPTDNSRALFWDAGSLLADEVLNLGTNGALVIGYPSNIWSFVISEGAGQLPANGTERMAVKYANGETIETRYFIDSESASAQDVFSTRGGYKDSMTWYARIPTNSAGTEFRQGIWAFGKGQDNAQLGVSVLLDTSSLGSVTNVLWNGNNLYIAHNSDWSVSRLDNFDTGTYDVKATAETVWYGNETPYQKELKGISVVTSPLPTGGEVEMFYRINDSDTWTSMGVSNTVGKMKHVFTKVNGNPLGKFQEIQFKFTVLGKVSVQNVFIKLEETEDLAF